MVHSGNSDGTDQPPASPTEAGGRLPLTEVSKYQAIQNSKTAAQLCSAIDRIGPVKGTKATFEPKKLKEIVQHIYQHSAPFNMLTRSYGLRQQLMYIMYYENRLHLL